MNKLSRISIPCLLLVLLASCNMEGHSLGVAGEDESPTLPVAGGPVTTQAATSNADLRMAAYDRSIVAGKTVTWANTYAGVYAAMLGDGKSEEWSDGYARQMADGKTPDYARKYADAYEEQIWKNGKSKGWANNYALKKAEGKSDRYAQRYADVYDAQRKAKKSHHWANSYALQIAGGKNEAFAANFAKAYESQRNAGQPLTWGLGLCTTDCR